MINKLIEQNISKTLLEKVIEYKNKNTIDEQLRYRIPKEKTIYLGKEIWEQAITAILQGSNILLVGPKSTGKNLLATNLAQLFERPSWNISLNLNTDESQLLGVDTFKDNQVIFRNGPITSASLEGGFAILDEINMAKNESLSVLHSSLDDRRIIDIPGYDLINIHPLTRFIATMNYGYLGTKELNEALVSRFLVIELPQISQEQLELLIRDSYPNIRQQVLSSYVKFFKDMELKVENSEISSRPLDLRGLLSSLKSVQMGLDLKNSLTIAIKNKTFDDFEKEIIEDLIKINFPKNYTRSDIFEG